MTLTRRFNSLGACIMLFLATGLSIEDMRSAFAGTEQAMKAREREAKKACLSAVQYERGIDILAELYVDTNNPTHIYNQGRCYQQNGKHDKALDRFQEYQRTNAKQSRGDVSDLELRIRECEQRLAQTKPATVLADPAREKPGPESGPGPLPDVVVSNPSHPELKPEQDGRGLRIAGAILSGVGLIGIGTGVTMNYLYSEKSKTPDKGTYAAELSDRTNTYRVGGWVGYGVGAAALITGVTLYLLDSQSSPGGATEGGSITWIPTYNGETASVLLQRFF